MSDHAPLTVYRLVPAMHLLCDRQRATPVRTSLGMVRLAATRLHRAATMLIDWDRAAGQGWPRLQPWSVPLPQFRRFGGKRHAAFFPRLSGKWN